VVNSADINAFALPGGFVYVNRGLIEAARTEGELAGVLAHEMAHVALRHGTAQVSKAYAAQLGVGALGVTRVDRVFKPAEVGLDRRRAPPVLQAFAL
jgi:predicted Zn-dependent protease